ncbi:replication protein [Peribacillus frigoritolerans]|uniref:Replication protein n=1 Tax=Peribacillus castrilensis TaxID=2897690 RepID=A0AAW9NM46_9BACI|nr:replication protein [Peribacillus castrilensis]
MPWSKESKQLTKAFYQSVINHLAENINPELMELDMRIKDEFLKSNFTKRQRVIMTMIYTLSYGLRKNTAIMPKLQNFELAGISKKKIKNELDQLVAKNVITWEREGRGMNYFQINDPDLWEADYHDGYNNRISQELLFLNLEHSGFDTKPVKNAIKEEELV